MTAAASPYDVIIIGTGAGGGTLTWQLAPSGKRILLLERGDYLPGEAHNGEITEALYRLRSEDFGEIRHHDGMSPAWPIGYELMEPYYTRAEELYQVHGARGEDPTEPLASVPYPYPPVSHEPRIQRLSDDLTAAGFNPFHTPSSVLLKRSDPEVIAVRPALEFDNVTRLTQARAVRLETNPAGNAVTQVVVEHDGQLERYSGDIVVVSCGAANSARLLLRSASDTHPGGLANGSDEVGRNFMFHATQAVLALSRQPNPTVFQKTLGLNDFYFRGPDFGYPMGTIQLMEKSQGPMYRGEKELETTLSATWALDDVVRHAVDFWLSTEDLPQSENRITLDEQGNIRLRYRASNETAGQELYRQLRNMLGVMGMHDDHLIHRSAYARNIITQQAGTCRFGTDPATSVLDVNCKAHELDNLYVVDTSFLPSIGAVDPTLTALANAIRVGDHLLERLNAPAIGASTVAAGRQ